MSGKTLPRFRSRADRAYFALRKYHGLGDTESWPKEKIADHLNVKVETVEEYLKETPQAEEVMARLEDFREETHREMILNLRERLSKLYELEEQLMEAVEVVVTHYDFEKIKAEIQSADLPGDVELEVVGSHEVDVDVPVPGRIKQIPQFGRLQKVWEEQRDTQEQLAELLDINEGDTVNVHATITESKVWELGGEEADLPDQEVTPTDEAESI